MDTAPTNLVTTDVPRVSVVIVTWNSQSTIVDCLNSVLASDGPEVELIVVDNASDDGTVKRALEVDGVVLVESEHNAGYAPAVNRGLQSARGEYVFTLNPDTVVEKDTIRLLASTLDATNAACAGPRLLQADGSLNPFGARAFPSISGTLVRGLGLSRLPGLRRVDSLDDLDAREVPDARPVPCLSGAALMIRASVLRSIGHFDQMLPMYYEDLELCARLRASNLNRLFVPRATVRHLGGHSRKQSEDEYLLMAMEHAYAPWLYFRRFRSQKAASSYALTLGFVSGLRLVLSACLRPALRLFGRDDEVLKRVAERARAVLWWLLTPRREVDHRIEIVFSGRTVTKRRRALGGR